MIRFLLTRALESLAAIWGLVTIVFIVTRFLGDPVVLLLPLGASPEQITEIRVALGLDDPLWVQYFHYLWHVLHGDFGLSFVESRPAMQVVLERMPATMTLALVAIALGVLIGSAAGFIAAVRRGSIVELIVMVLALIGQATPVFWLGLMLILIFSVNLGWLPTGGTGSLRHLVLPSLTLAVFTSAAIARLLRSSMIDVLREDYVRTAHAKGLMPSTVFIWHAARNALIPVVTMTAILMGELLGGSVVTETVFSWPGVGRLIVQAINTQDFPVVQAGITLVATTFVLINFGVDLLYGVLDPRIRIRR
jgi:peptide/nickel transport system permease protein